MDAAGKYEGLIGRVIDEVRPYTVVPYSGLECTILQTIDALEKGVPGVLVECGVWRGGASFAMLLAQRYAFGEIRRPVWMYDSFQGMGDPTKEDGHHGEWWKRRALTVPIDPDGQNYVTAEIEEVREAADKLGLLDHTRMIEGWFSNTLADPADAPAQIAVLRVDCDWYEPCALVYQELVPNVSDGGRIIVDDYGIWEGCTLATHEFLAREGVPWPIRSVPADAGMYMVKATAAW